MGLLTKPTQSPRVWFEIPGLDTFQVLVEYQTPEDMKRINQACQKNVLDKATRQIVTETDNDAFARLMTRSIVKDWRGLTLSVLKKLMPVSDETAKAIEESNGELPFDEKDLHFLAEHTYAPTFIAPIMDIAMDMLAFRKAEEAAVVKNSVG